MSRDEVPGGMLWITRMETDENDTDVVRLAYAGDGAERTFRQALRVIKERRQDPNDLRKGDLIVTLLDGEGDTTAHDPLRVPARQADWFLKEWLQWSDR